ncbi:hypothetical protein GORHZ_191_00020 [Gordonia rhizosphera NBRC 16068]|uniref:Uncharacterized protein n=1 Tax=Gordonia rhizosphera NBRC 16068 TaxID=1108045 RepID=K6V944_9ACTN|nr:hypothetical protein GORHZ_191_00020 [Gordonia rhizosphera NBRC 16068]
MPTSSWLPSESEWIDHVASEMLDGRKYLVRGLPRWGLSTVCESLVDIFGDSAQLVRGRDFTESNQSELRERVDESVTAAVEKHGIAQLVFDDYGHALRRSQGGALHSTLYRLLVDGRSARDIGAFFVARTADPLDPHFSGSPLLSRVESKALPRLHDDDCAAVGQSSIRLRALAGDSTWLARRFLGKSADEAELDTVERLAHDARRLVEALPPDTIEVLRNVRRASDITPAGREALRCIGSVIGDQFELAELVAQTPLLDEVEAVSPGWPAVLDASVGQFAKLLNGVSSAIWIDRYIFSDPSDAARFLALLANHSGSKLRILTSDDYNRPDLANEIRTALRDIDNVQVRFMLGSDRRALHDRHLVIPADKTGYTLPTSGVIVGRDDPGSAVSTRMPYLSFDYSKCWQRARVVYP